MEYTKIKEDYFHTLCHCVENGMTLSDFKALTNGGKDLTPLMEINTIDQMKDCPIHPASSGEEIRIHINCIIQKLTQEQHDTLEAACFLITLPQVGLL